MVMFGIAARCSLSKNSRSARDDGARSRVVVGPPTPPRQISKQSACLTCTIARIAAPASGMARTADELLPDRS
jgi:hypothetical protein